MSIYTCNGCELQFTSRDDQKQHMKSEWHRYNLKRKVAQLTPISEKMFNDKVQVLLGDNKQIDVNNSNHKQLTRKEARRKERETLSERKKELLNIAHKNATKPKEEFDVNEPRKLNDYPCDSELTEDQLGEKLLNEKILNRVDIPIEECLFCGKKYPNLDGSTEHMLKSHGFFIPEQKYLIDKPGLIKYISEKIGLGNICIVCSYQGRSLEAVRQHMLAKRHCRIPYEEEEEKLEISEFYDFTSSYGEQISSFNDTNDEDWEDLDANNGYEGINENEEGEYVQDAIYHDGVELHLPTGVKAGHRSLMRYYRQNLKPESELSEGQGTIVAAEARKPLSLQPYDKKKIQSQKRSWKQEIKSKKDYDKKGAKHMNFQPHYRDQLLQ